MRFLAIVLPLLALALFAVALFSVADRRRAALNVGIAVFLVGALNFAAFLVVRAVLLTSEDGDRRDVVAGIFDAFMGRLRRCGAGCSRSRARSSPPRPRRSSASSTPRACPSCCGGASRASPDATWKLVVGALVLILVGLAVIGDPIGAVRLAVVRLRRLADLRRRRHAAAADHRARADAGTAAERPRAAPPADPRRARRAAADRGRRASAWARARRALAPRSRSSTTNPGLQRLHRALRQAAERGDARGRRTTRWAPRRRCS